MDTAEKVFNQLLDEGKEEVDRLIKVLASESLIMDYKQKRTPDGAVGLEDDDKRNFKKALSGFANSQGGVILWGVDKKDGSIGSYKPIKSPEVFVENLNSLEPNMVSPCIDGVRHELIFKDGDAGVVATYVPASQKSPHRTVGRDGQYYKRHGDRFQYMEHFEIEDMFGRRARPKLELKLSSRLEAQSRPATTYLLKIELSNVGKAISRDYAFDLEFFNRWVETTVGYRDRPSFINHSSGAADGTDWLRYRNVHDRDRPPLYPGETVVISPHNYRLGHLRFKATDEQLAAQKDVVLKYRLYSEDMQPQEGAVRFGDLFKPRW